MKRSAQLLSGLDTTPLGLSPKLSGQNGNVQLVNSSLILMEESTRKVKV